MKKKVVTAIMVMAVGMGVLTGCKSTIASMSVRLQADSLNVNRRLTVINSRTDTILLQIEGKFSLSNNGDNELEITCETNDGEYQKHFVYLNDDTLYVVEDLTGTDEGEVDFLPEEK